MSVKGLERAIQNLNSLSRLIVPEATAKALNRVASRTISQGSKAVAKEATVDDTRTAKITNTGKPELAEESGTPNIPVTGVTLDKATASVVVGATTTLNVTVNPASASDTSFRVATSDGAKATVTVSGNAITVTGVAAGTADVIVMTSDGSRA